MAVKVTRGRHDSGKHRILGKYFPGKDLIRLYIDDIRAHAKEYDDDPNDLEALVYLHEEGHQRMRKIRDTLTDEQEEQLADQYAFWNFYKREGRFPLVNLKGWRSV